MSQVVFAHATGATVPPAQYCPATHAVQMRSLEDVGTCVSYVPAAQTVNALQLVAFDVLVKVPPAHAAQARFAVALGVFVWYVPARQFDHATQAVAGFASLSQFPVVHATGAAVPPAQYCPAAHAEQTRSVVDVGACVSYEPAAHTVTALQLVAFVVSL